MTERNPAIATIQRSGIDVLPQVPIRTNGSVPTEVTIPASHSNGHVRELLPNVQGIFLKAMTEAKRPSPCLRPAAPKLSEPTVNLIADTAKTLGPDHTEQLRAGLTERQLDHFTNTFVESYTRQAAIRNALAEAERPSPSPHQEGPAIPKEEMTRIFAEAKAMGLNPVSLTEELGKKNRLGTFRQAYTDAYQPSPRTASSVNKVTLSTPLVHEPRPTNGQQPNGMQRNGDSETRTLANGDGSQHNGHLLPAEAPHIPSIGHGHENLTNGYTPRPTRVNGHHHEDHAEHLPSTDHDYGHLPRLHIESAAIPQHTSALTEYERIYKTALKQAKKRIIFQEITNETLPISDSLLGVIEDAGERLGIRKIAEVEDLSPAERDYFNTTFADLYTDFQFQDQMITTQVEDLIRDEHVPLHYINPDGTFQADKIQELPYFLDDPKLFKTFEFATRQLPESSHSRKEAKNRYDKEHAGHDHGPGEHHDNVEKNGGACCSTHRKKEISLLRTQRKYGRYPRIATAISKVKELGWLALCPGDDLANLASNVIAPLLSGGDGEDHHHTDPNAIVPKTPLAVVHEAEEVRDERGRWRTLHVESMKIEDAVSFAEGIDELERKSHANDHYGHGHGHERHDEHDEQAVVVDKKKPKIRIGKRFIAAAATIVALGAGIAGIGKIANDSENTERAEVTNSIVAQPTESPSTTQIPQTLPVLPDTPTVPSEQEVAAPTPSLAHVVYEQVNAQIPVQTGDSFWEIGERQLKTIPGTNWESPYGSSRNDIILDFSRDLGGVAVETVSTDNPVSVAGNLSPESRAIIADIAATDSYEEYQTHVAPKVERAYAAQHSK